MSAYKPYSILALNMNKITLMIRSLPLNPYKANASVYFYISSRYSSSKKDADNEKISEPREKQEKKDALSKLNLLLKKMVDEDVVYNSKKLNLAAPRSHKNVRKEPGTESIKTQPVEKRIVTAVKGVAETLGGNVKQTESELLTRLLNPINEEKLNDKQAISANLSEVVKGMKIDREAKTQSDFSRAKQVKSILENVEGAQRKGERDHKDKPIYRKNLRVDKRASVLHTEKIDLFGSQPLGIFSVPEPKNETEQDEAELQTWKMLHNRELRLAVSHPPLNYFQEMILWTEQGKLWKFPIDNEQGMEEEQNIYFAEHVFLEEHLEPWCPPKGPIRHFMELVCVGLSKNPYMSVQHKREHIAWYRNYFGEKSKLLQEVGAIPAEFNVSNSEKSLNN